MKKLSLLLAMVMMLLLAGTASAALTTIGTATYMGSDYNLIYEDDSIDGGLVWLDYTNSPGTWQNHMDWASGLGSNLTVNLYSGYTMDIDWSTGWRLPRTDESQCNLSGGFGYEGPDASGYHAYEYGFNMVNSEMGHLYYESLGNLGRYATDGSNPQSGFGLQNECDFNNLQSGFCWTGTKHSLYPLNMWYFDFIFGEQDCFGYDAPIYAMAVRPANVVPIPSAVWLLGSGLIGLVGFRKKVRKEV